jgi:hypothetical protein
MFNLCRYIKSIKTDFLLTYRYLSISKSDLVESSRNIQELLKSSNNDDSSFCSWLYQSLNKIHSEYSSTKLAQSTKTIYEINSSKLNPIFVQFENDRKKQIGNFQQINSQQLIVLLRYIRYLQIAFIYRLITYDINNVLKQISNSILNLTKNPNNFNEKFVEYKNKSKHYE